MPRRPRRCSPRFGKCMAPHCRTTATVATGVFCTFHARMLTPGTRDALAVARRDYDWVAEGGRAEAHAALIALGMRGREEISAWLRTSQRSRAAVAPKDPHRSPPCDNPPISIPACTLLESAPPHCSTAS